MGVKKIPGNQEKEGKILNNRGTRWVFTEQNWSAIEEIKNLFEILEMKYLIIGKEIAPTTGQQHLQGYFRLKDKKYRSTIMNQYHFDYLDIAKGSEEECDDYCKKGGDFEQLGEVIYKKETANLKVSKDEKTRMMLNDLVSMSKADFEAIHTYEAYHNRNKLDQWELTHCKHILAWNGELKDKNVWIYGPPKTGKSRWAYSQVEADEMYIKNVNKWWCGFKPRETRCVIIDDWPMGCKGMLQFIKNWGDRYMFQGELKGSSVMIEPGRFFLIVTANNSIEESFKGLGTDDDIKAVKRRFKEVFIMDSNDIFLQTKLNKQILQEL